MSDDPVVDYFIMEAVAAKVAREDADAQKEAQEEAKRQEFKKDVADLEQFR